MKPFRSPKSSLGDLDAEAAASLIAASADISLILDEQGVIRDVAFSSEELADEIETRGKLLGRAWIDTVTVESRGKVEALLRDAASPEPQWRHINHPSGGDADVPVLYLAARFGTVGRTVVFGRDLRALSALQQRLIAAQQSMERDYSRLRHVETRYRILFQLSSEAVLIVDAMSQRILEANPAAAGLFGEDAKRLIGRNLPDIFAPDGVRALENVLAGAREGNRLNDSPAVLAEGGREVMISAQLFRQENVSLYLVRLSAPSTGSAAAALVPQAKSKLLKVVESAPDGFVVTTEQGVILTANAAFLDMAGLAIEEQARGESLDRWLDGASTVLLSTLRQHGSVRLFSTTVTGEFGAVSEVEVSAVSVKNGGQPCFGFAVRNIGRRLAPVASPKAGRELPRSVEQLTELIGRVSLKDLVREATDVIERLCIEAALELTGDNRASAAEMLGLSRQSLYVKLRRYGLGDLASENGG